MAGDYSNSNHILTWSSNARTQGESILFNGSNSNPINVADSADWQFAADFTIELFGVVFNDNTDWHGLIGHYTSSINQRGWAIDFRGDETPKVLSIIVSSTGGDSTVIRSNEFVPTVGTPYNLTVERASGVIRFYVDGVMNGSVANTTVTHNSTSTLVIGRGASSEPSLDGQIRAVRITNGIARYANDGGYIVPTLPLPTRGIT